VGRLEGMAAIDETLNQIMVTRGMIAKAPGQVFWSIAPLVDRPALGDTLRHSVYRQPALVPPSPWLDEQPPGRPAVDATVQGDSILISWTPQGEEAAFRWIISWAYGDQKAYRILSQDQRYIHLPLFALRKGISATSRPQVLPPPSAVLKKLSQVELRAVDRTGQESGPQQAVLPAFRLGQAAPLASFYRDPAPRPLNGLHTGWSVLTRRKRGLLNDKDWAIATNIPDWPGSQNQPSPGRLRAQIDVGQSGLTAFSSSLPVWAAHEAFAQKGIQTVVIDWQLDGSGWDTDLPKLYKLLRHCAWERLAVLVVDRPNPLGGELIEGPLLPRADSLGGSLPVRHGMTTAELILYWNDVFDFDLALQTVSMANWHPAARWPATGMAWESGRADLAGWPQIAGQPGMRLFEMAGFDPGFAAQQPYQAIVVERPGNAQKRKACLDQLRQQGLPGAHWIRMYTPAKRKSVWTLRLLDGAEAQYVSVRKVLTAMNILYRQYPGQFSWFAPGISPAPGTPGRSAKEVYRSWQQEIEAFRARRLYYVLYDRSAG